MSGVRHAAVLALFLGCALSAGCLVPTNRLAAIESQYRVLAEQNRSLAAENETLNASKRHLEDRLAEFEEQFALADADRSLDQRRIANYHLERDVVDQQFGGLIQQAAGPVGMGTRLAGLSRRYKGLRYDEQTGIAKLQYEVLFDEGEAVLKPESQKMLREFASLFQDPAVADLRVMVVGHTDNRLMAKRPARDQYPNNWRLSTARSEAVAEFLKKQGLAEEQMGIAGFAQHQPIAANSNEDERQYNRRVEIFVTGPETPIIGCTETIPSLYR